MAHTASELSRGPRPLRRRDERRYRGHGATLVQQYVKAGLLDEMQIHVAPVLLGGGVSLFDRLDIDPVELEATRVIESPLVTHLRFRVPRGAPLV
ncbi:MAG: dihydrofolate reductase family protein [Gaiellaceae bacterium]